MKTFGGLFDIDNKKNKLKELQKESQSLTFWNSVDKANKIVLEIGNLNKEINGITILKEKLISFLELTDLTDEFDMIMINELTKEYEEIVKLFEQLNIKSLLNKKYDSYDCILEIHPGAGGTESCDWASMLLNMYKKYASQRGYKFEILEEQKGEEAGIKSVTAMISGSYAYGYYKSERGVHRLVRISPFDSNSRRHTSFASVSIIPNIENDKSIDIDPDDLKIDVFHSGGAGGQSVNTTDSAVRITHLPTKTVVSCQNERSQLKNKEKAMSILISKLIVLKEEEELENLAKLKGENVNINFGSQIRSYTLEPYKLIKDNRFDYETNNVENFLNGDLTDLINAYLKSDSNNQ